VVHTGDKYCVEWTFKELGVRMWTAVI